MANGALPCPPYCDLVIKRWDHQRRDLSQDRTGRPCAALVGLLFVRVTSTGVMPGGLELEMQHMSALRPNPRDRIAAGRLV
jgi:hypothetical protein